MLDKRNKVKYWGAETIYQAKRYKDLNISAYFKLFLNLESLEQFYGQNDELRKLHDLGGYGYKKNKNLAVKLTKDYLKLFNEHALEHIFSKEADEEFSLFSRGKLLKKYKVRYVITVPTMWNDSTRRTFSQAIEGDFLGTRKRNQLTLISEPEAAALYLEQHFSQYFLNQRETTFIVCDADDLTVNVVAMQITVPDNQENGKLDSGSILSQIGDGLGDICGLRSLDNRFKNYILQMYDEMGINGSMLDLNDTLEQFERIKVIS